MRILVSALIVLLILTILLLTAFVILLVWSIRKPPFDGSGHIRACEGCGGCSVTWQRGCRFNPEYWDGKTYIGPSRRARRALQRSGAQAESKEVADHGAGHYNQ